MSVEEQVTRLLLVGAILAVALPARAHGDCSKDSGIDRARCERHAEMFKTCGPLKGDAHHACDREFLIANPLKCGGMTGGDAERCGKEVAAFKACEPQMGREFARCVRKATNESPMGHR